MLSYGDLSEHDLYEIYYKITGLWWTKIDNMFDPIRWYIYKKCKDASGAEKNVTSINNWFERFMASDYVKITCDTETYLKHPKSNTLRHLIRQYVMTPSL